MWKIAKKVTIMRSQYICKYIIAFLDFILCFFSLLIALVILDFFTGEVSRYIPYNQLKERVVIHFVLSLICMMWFWVRLRHYTYRRPFWFELKEILRTLVIFSVIELAIIAFSKLYFSRYLWVLTWAGALIIVPIGRILIKKLLIKSKVFLKNTIIIGDGDNAIDAYYALMSEPYLGFKIKYFIVKKSNTKLEDLGIAILIDSKGNFLNSEINKTDQFILALEDNETEERDYWLRYLSKNHYRSVSVIPTLRGLPLYSTDMSFIFSYEVILLRINNNLAKRSSRILKRTMDVIGSSLLIILFSPVLFLLYLFISWDGGSAIYGHIRIGRNGKPFRCWKFRTMVLNSNEVLKNLLEQDPIAKAEWEKDCKLKNDPRITKLGFLLRKMSLDELPQLFNVLFGQMSLVGPRPIVRHELTYYEENIDYYLMAKPGMTGLWQVSGRNNVDYETRVYFDSWYVKNWSLWNDIAILFKTVKVVLKRNGAY